MMNQYRCILIVLFFLVFVNTQVFSQAVVETKNGEMIEMNYEYGPVKDSMAYFTKKIKKKKISLFGLGMKKMTRDYKKDGVLKTIALSDIHRVHVNAEIVLSGKKNIPFKKIKFIKEKKKYKEYMILEDGYSSLLVRLNIGGNVSYTYFIQIGDETPVAIHEVGVAMGKKYKGKVKKIFKDCQPSLDYISKMNERTEKRKLKFHQRLMKLVSIYNENCNA